MCYAVQEQYRKDMTLKEAEAAALSILKQVMEEKVGRSVYISVGSGSAQFNKERQTSPRFPHGDA